MLSTDELRNNLIEVDRKGGKESLFYFAKNILGYDALDYNPHREVCQFAQEIVGRDHYGLDLEPRGSFKTTVFSQALPIWLLVKNPNLRILLNSAVLQNSIDNLRVIKSQFETNEKLRFLFGDFVGSYWTTEEATVGKRTKVTLRDPSLRCASVERVQTGPHYDVIIADDLVSDQNSMTPDGRNNVINHFKLLFSLLDPGGIIMVVGTRWNYEDLYGVIMSEFPLFKTRVKSAISSDGTLYFPKRLTKDFLEQTKKIQGREIFSGQYQNDPAPEDADAKFQRSWFKRYKDAPSNRISFISIDPGGAKKGSDEWVMIVAHVDEHNNKYFDRLLHGNWKQTEAWHLLFRLIEQYDPMVVGLETTGGQKWLYESLMDEMRSRDKFFQIKALTHAGDSKEYRIQRLQPQYQAGAIFHSPEMGPLEDQLLRFPKGKDDIADAASMILEIATPPRAERNKKNMPKSADEYLLYKYREEQRNPRRHSLLGEHW